MNEQAYVDWLNATVELDFGETDAAIAYFEEAIQKATDDVIPWLNHVSLLDDRQIRFHMYQYLQDVFPYDKAQIEAWIDGDRQQLDIDERWVEFDLFDDTMADVSRLTLWRDLIFAIGYAVRAILIIRPIQWGWRLMQWRSRDTDDSSITKRIDAIVDPHYKPLLPDYENLSTQLLSRTLLEQLAELRVKEPTRTDLEILITELTQEQTKMNREQELVATLTSTLELSSDVILPANDRRDLQQLIRNEVVGLGILQELLDDSRIYEITIYHHEDIRIDRHGNVEKLSVVFESDAQVLRIINRLIAPLGIRFNEENPVLTAQTADGMMINGVTQPVSVNTVVTIRKDSYTSFSMIQLIQFGTLTSGIAEFLYGAVQAKANILFVGGKNSGITSLVAAMTSFVPEGQSIAIVEARSRLLAQHDAVIYLYTISADGTKVGTSLELMDTAIRLRTDQIILADFEDNGTEGLLRRMSDRRGVFLLRPARSTQDVINALEQELYTINPGINEMAARTLISNGINLIVEQQRLRDGSRRIVNISELSYERAGNIQVETIFEFVQTGIDDGRVIGRMQGTGYIPKLHTEMEEIGVEVETDLYASRRTRKRTTGIFQYVKTSHDPLPEASWATQLDDEIRSAPYLTDNGILVGAYDNTLRLLDYETGETHWKFETMGGISTTPIIDKESDLCIFGSEDTTIYALRLQSGRLNWTVSTEDKIRSSPELGHGIAFVGSDDGKIYALKASNGRQIWSYDCGAPIRSKASVADTFIVCGTETGTLMSLSLDGTRRWVHRINGRSYAQPIIDTDVCYVPLMANEKGLCLALDNHTGAEVWRYALPSPIIANPIYHEHILIIATTDGQICAINTASGKASWQQRLTGGVVAGLQLLRTETKGQSAMICVGTLDGKFTLLDAISGQLCGQFQLSGPIMGIAHNKYHIVITSLDHHVYCMPLDNLLQVCLQKQEGSA